MTALVRFRTDSNCARRTSIRVLCYALCCALSVLVFVPSIMRAQIGVFSGVVTGDSLGHPVTRAEVALPQLHRVTLADEQGGFRFNDVPAGHYAVTVRAIGFDAFTDSVTIAAGDTLDGELTLSPAVTHLASVRTTAPTAPQVPPRLQEFVFRDRAQITGYFLSDSALRRHDREDLVSVIGMLPGVRVLFVKSYSYLASGHGGNSSGPVFKSNGGSTCLFTVFLDGMRMFQSGDGSPPPDFRKMRVEDYYGVEVYPSAASVPAQYSSTGTNCGAILLWSRPWPHP